MDELAGLVKKKKSTRGVQTLFRVTFRTQVNLIRIADNKANMILGINAMIITVLMGFISTGIILPSENFGGETVMLIPMILIILTSLCTAVFAIRVAKPRLLKRSQEEIDNSKNSSLLFFENVWQLSTEEYIHKMENLIESPQDIYQNMIIDIHNQARVLHRKYHLLRLSYVIFMVGFTLSITVFLLLWLFIS